MRPGPKGFDSAKMFKMADQAGELTDAISQERRRACTALKNVQRAYDRRQDAQAEAELAERHLCSV